jgi:aspartyl-tRNA(Asn)/glutamyl-tRNA(Gln) amidotransferase subunit A
VLDSGLGELQAALAARRVSSVELTQLHLARIRDLNGPLNAFITVDEQASLEQAPTSTARPPRPGR